MGKKDKMAAKKKPIAEARLIENLKTVNARLVEETAECRREIERLSIYLASLVAEKDIFVGIQHDVFALVISSSLQEFASEKAIASNREKSLKNKVEAMAREANAKDVELLVLVKEKVEKEKELEELRQKIESMEQAKEQGRRKFFLCTVAAIAAAAGAALMTFWKK